MSLIVYPNFLKKIGLWAFIVTANLSPIVFPRLQKRNKNLLGEDNSCKLNVPLCGTVFRK